MRRVKDAYCVGDAVVYRFVNDALVLNLCRFDSPSVEQPHIDTINRVLDRWHQQWAALKNDAVRRKCWDSFGFWCNGDQYEAAIRVLVSEKVQPFLKAVLKGNVNRLKLLRKLYLT